MPQQSKQYNPFEHSIVQAALKADGYQRYECSEFVEALLRSLVRELERVYWNWNQEQFEDRKDREFLEIEGFEYRRYFWDDCDCGFDEIDHQWSQNNKHSEECYYTVTHRLIDELPFRKQINDLIKERAEYKFFSKEADAVQEQIKTLSRQEDEAQTAIRRTLCEQLGIAWSDGYGSAVHCTCGHRESYSEWRETHDHSETCSPQLPNMAFGEVRVSWYKYLGRGMSVNVDWNEKQWREWFDACFATLGTYDICAQYHNLNERVQVRNCPKCKSGEEDE